MLLRAFLVWLGIIAVEFLHGVIRVLLIAPALGDFRSRQFGVFVGSALILAVAVALICWIPAKSNRRLLFIGFFWVVLTLVFEITLGIAMGLTSERIFEDYNIVSGGLMPLGLLFLFLTPVIASRIRRCGG